MDSAVQTLVQGSTVIILCGHLSEPSLFAHIFSVDSHGFFMWAMRLSANSDYFACLFPKPFTFNLVFLIVLSFVPEKC